MRLAARAAGVMATVVVALAGAAKAQEADSTGRYDIDDALRRHPHDIGELPTIEAARGRPVTFDLSLRGVYTTNAGTTPSDRIETGYLTPGLGVSVTPVPLMGWSVGAGAAIDGDYYNSDYDDQVGEGRLEGFVYAQRPLGSGTLTAEFVMLGVYADDFSEKDFHLAISNLTYSASLGPIDAELSAEYEHSDVPEERRTRLAALAAHTLAEPQLGYDLTIEGDLIFSDFNGGTNARRNDVTAALVLLAERELGEGLWLTWEAAFVNRFSNRERSRFTAIDLGVEISKAF
ncbi:MULTISPECIES: cupredoxin domain-containing protein [Phenylobacterium]|uniref:Transporter n=1 Tax=Phenylobacterium koreense TaxID=266125 RepID=A0ABV2EET5_9CAUL